MGKNVAVFVDVANIFYAAKAAGVDIDYVTLLKASSAGRDLVRAYAYTGLDPDNENQRNFHDFLRRHGYKVVSKDIRKYGDGKVKANLDIELVVDMMKTARNLDIAIVVSGDGDFAPAIRAVQEQGVRVEVVSFRGNTSSDLMDVADQFTDITQIAKVEKGSSRSGRRVATDDEDLSMTEVPDKQSEGSGERSRGRGRTRRTTTGTSTSRGRSRVAAAPSDGEAPIVVLPGEKLSRAAAAPTEGEAEADLEVAAGDVELGDAAEATDGSDNGTEESRRRRRRRGGRGRGRGRGRDEGGYVPADDEPERVAARSDEGDAEDEDEEAPAPARRPTSSFGSVWDSQIGIGAASRGAPLLDDDEDLEEPAVPEYLLAERRQRDAGRGGMRGGRGGGGRGRGGAYAAALDRERFGGGRGSTPSRFQEPAPRGGGFDRPARDRMDRGDRRGPADRRPFRDAPRPAPRGTGDEPWSEVPPEIEAMLRAQLAAKPVPVRREPVAIAPEGEEPAPVAEVSTERPARRASRATAGTSTRSRRAGAAPEASADADAASAEDATPAAKPARRTSTTRRSTSTKAAATEVAEESAPAPRRTPRRTKATEAPAQPATADVVEAEAAPAPKRRTTRRKAEPAG